MESRGNSFTGSVAIQGGKLGGAAIVDAGTNSSFGAGSMLTLSGGTALSYTVATSATNRNVMLETGGGEVEVVDPAAVLSFNGSLSGDGALTKSGVGTLALVNIGNSFAGDVAIAAGRLSGAAIADTGANSSFGAGG